MSIFNATLAEIRLFFYIFHYTIIWYVAPRAGARIETSF